MIPLLRPPVTKEDADAVSKQILSGQLAGGQVVTELEEAFAEYVGSKYAVAVDSCTAGFEAVLQLLNPTYATLPTATYVSMANTLANMGVDIRFQDGWIAGDFYEIETDKGIIVDSAHALEEGITEHNSNAIWLFSFHATKLLATGKGGMITTNSKEQYNFLKTLVNNGRVYGNNTFEFTVHSPGRNYYMSDIVACLALSQLKRIDKTNKKRDEVKKIYEKYLKPDLRDNWSRYIYQIYVDDFQEFYKQSRAAGIQVSKHFNPIHLQPYFDTGEVFSYAEGMANHMISIPFYADMKESDVKIVSEFINNNR